MSNLFSTLNYLDQYPDLAFSMAEVAFPQPFTVGDYRRWFRAMKLHEEGDGELGERQVFLRQYRGALAVATITPLETEPPVTAVAGPSPDSDEFIADYSPFDNRPYTPLDLRLIDPDEGDLPVSFASFVVEAAEEYIGPKIIVTPLQEVVKRRQESKHRYPVFQHDFCLDLLPDMAGYKGYVLYHDPLTRNAYRRYTKAIAVRDGVDPRDIDNSLLLRQLRGAVALVEQFKFRDLKWNELTANDCERMPLELASFLVETCDVFLSKRMSAKK